MRKFYTSAFGALIIAAAAWAQTPINEKRLAEPNGTIEIKNTVGRVQVESWDQNEIQVVGELSKKAERLEFTSENGQAVIEVIIPKGVRNPGETKLYVRAPATNRLMIKAVSGGIDVSGMSKDIEVETVSGGIRIAGAGGDVKATTVSGGVNVQGTIGDCDVEAVSGGIQIKTASGEVRATTVSGGVEVEGTGVDRIQCESVSGSVRYTGSLENDAKVSMKTHSGSVLLKIPASTSAEVEAEVFSGSIKNELSDKKVWKPKYGPGAMLETTLGNGDGDIELETFSGSITLGILERAEAE